MKAPNQKVVAVSADLKSKRLMDLVLALAVIHIHVTGPLWQMCEFDDVKYIELGCKYIQPFLPFIEQCIDNPARIEDNANTNPLAEFRTSRLREYESKNSMGNTNDTQLSQSTIMLLATAFRYTIRRQLSDFIDGPYSEIPNEQAIHPWEASPLWYQMLGDDRYKKLLCVLVLCLHWA